MNQRKNLSLFLLAALVTAASWAAAQENQGPALLRAGLEKRLQELSGQLDGLMGYAVKYLASDDRGEETLIRAARAAHSYFERLAGANIYGRALPN